MAAPETMDHDRHDPTTLALQALVWTLADPARAQRLLELTGLDANDLRQSAGQRSTLAAVLTFLAGHEPDLLACAAALDIKPAVLIAAHQELEP